MDDPAHESESPGAARRAEPTTTSDQTTVSMTVDRLNELSLLLRDLERDQPSAQRPPAARFTQQQQNQLVQVRLGIASSLFAALRWKHEPTAEHSLRVALFCSAWAEQLGFDAEQRDELEVAALLHDIGKIGIPDQLLLKSRPLAQQETDVMEGHWVIGNEILRICCASQGVLDVVTHARDWFDGSRGRGAPAGEKIPLGARMLAIADAYDAMVTDQVYRRAISHERAIAELFECAGRQFDPTLVRKFNEFRDTDPARMQETSARRWLHALDPLEANDHWRLCDSPLAPAAAPDALFEQRLLDNMYDAVVFIDANLRILRWNHGAERLTGIAGPSIQHRSWLPSLLHMRDESDEVISDENCPIAYTLRTGLQAALRVSVRGRDGRHLSVHAQVIPVIAPNGTTIGVTLLLHDISSEISLAEECQSLHELTKRDPLTQLANRAEFDRVFQEFVERHSRSGRPCSLIIADIDRFKSINDTYGHPAGDDVIKAFSALLKSSCRTGDLVARYGGEEFAMLCADCDSGAVVRRAGEIRRQFAETLQPSIGNRAATASFGVTEIQPGDTPSTMLSRADRALLTAKTQGRNRVVQLGTGAELAAPDSRDARPKPDSRDALVRQHLVSHVPLSVSVEKLRGFIADHHGVVQSVDGNRVQICVATSSRNDAYSDDDAGAMKFLIDVELHEHRRQPGKAAKPAEEGTAQTDIHVEVRPQRQRDRRHEQAVERARQLAISLRAYMMASVVSQRTEPGGVLRMAKRLFLPWRIFKWLP